MSLAYSDTINRNVVAVIDDDVLMREDAMFWLDQNGLEARPLTGPYGPDIDKLVEEAIAGSDYVLCDQRLSAHNFLNRSGAEVAAKLYDRRVPTILISQYAGPDEPAFKPFKGKLPVVLPRDQLGVVDLRAKFEEARAELAQGKSKSRKPYRTIIAIDSFVQGPQPQEVVAFVQNWRPQQAVTIPLSVFPAALRGRVKPNSYFFADVNIGAGAADELYYENIEFAAEPPERGL